MGHCSEEFVLVLLGRTFKGYEQTLTKRIQNGGLHHRVFLRDAVPHAEILRYMASCDIGTAFYSNINVNNYYCASNKLFEYIALEKPVITNNYPGLLETVESYRQGVCVEEITPKSLAKAFTRACERDFVSPGAKKFFWEDEQSVLTKLYAQ
jgi:glycosyltransferase involved in cell wall biosynthesis